MIHTVIVPGVGGSPEQHWQSWLQHQLMSCSRVQQHDWNNPILDHWVNSLTKIVSEINQPIQIVAHSFGCLTSIAALNRFPELAIKVRKLILVAPANPLRFAKQGFAKNSIESYATYFHQLKLNTPTDMIISENDPWLCFEDAQILAQAWKVKARNLGSVGHINIESGFGPFPEIIDHLEINNSDSQRLHLGRMTSNINSIRNHPSVFKFAI